MVGGAAVGPLEVLRAQPRRVGAGGAARPKRLVELLQRVRPGHDVSPAAERAVRLVEAAGSGVAGDVGGEEDGRSAGEREVERDGRVVGDHGVDSRQHRVHVAQQAVVEHPHPVAGATGVIAMGERVSAHEQHRVVVLEPGVDLTPRAGIGHGRVVVAVAPRGCVQDDRRRQLTNQRGQRAARSVAIDCVQHVVTRVAGYRDAITRDAERARDAADDAFGRHREQLQLPSGRAVEQAHQRPAERRRQERRAQRDRRVQMQPLERDAVPQLHDETAAHAVAVHVTDTVRDDDDASAQGEPQPPRAELGDSVEPQRLGLGEFVGRRREPDQAHAVESFAGSTQQRQRALTETDPAAEHPDAAGARHQRGGDRAEHIERQVAQRAQVTRLEAELSHRKVSLRAGSAGDGPVTTSHRALVAGAVGSHGPVGELSSVCMHHDVTAR